MSAITKNSITIEERSSSRKGIKKCKQSIVKYVPILQWFPGYSRLDAVSDLVAGITLGLTMIPQSIAYAALAGLTAQYGLYSCFLGGFVYLVFGTIKEVSIGPSSLMALITIEYTRNMPVDFVVLFCFLAGCLELMMGMLHLGFVVDFISMPVTSGFTSATSVIIIISQLQGLLGLRIKAHDVIDNIYKIIRNVDKIRWPDLALGICSMAFLLIFRKLKDIDCSFANGNERSNGGRKSGIRKILWFLSIGRNALVILITATIACHLETTGTAPFILSGKVASGLPKVSLPPFSSQVGNRTYTFWNMCSHYGAGIVVLPLVSVLANVAIAKAFASGSAVNATQEMLTLGLCNIFGSLISSMPSCGAFTRSAVSSASGIRTPMAGLYTGIMTLLALSFLTPYFYYIPRATLAAVLISAVVFIIDLEIIKLLWKGCKRDAIAAVITFSVCIIFGVEVGLLIGALLSLIFFLRPSARPQIEVTEYKAHLGKKYVVLKPDTGLSYPAADFFCTKAIKIIETYDESDIPFVIDCERLRDVDYTAIKGIERMSKDLNKDGKRLWLLNVSPEIIESIRIFTNNKDICFIDDKDKISCIIYDDTVTNDTEEDAKMRLLKHVTENDALSYSNSDGNVYSNKSKTLAINGENCSEEISLTFSPPTKTNDNN